MTEIRIDVLRREVFIKGREVHLIPKEFDILVLLRDTNRVLNRQTIFDAIWGEKKSGRSERAIDQNIARLRRKVGKTLIQTVPGYGYKIARS